MAEIRLATIGTSIITTDLLAAVSQVDGIAYRGTFSRNPERAQAFTASHGGTTAYSTLEELCQDPDVDAVYIASPNALHFDQAMACVQAGKHVLVEKPLCPNRYQAEQLLAAAEVHNVVALEAMRPIHDPAWATVFASLGEIGRLRRATLRFGKYSSRYDELKAGKHTNIFDARMATGALMDLGVYCVEPMVALFGMPTQIFAMPTLVSDERSKLCSGRVDGAGSVLCRFERDDDPAGLVVELAYSKISTDLLPSQFEGHLGTITVDAVSVPQHVSLMRRGQAVRGGASTAKTSKGDVTVQLPCAPCDNNMVYELRDFVAIVEGRPVDTLWGEGLAPEGALASFSDVTLTSLAVTDEIRHQARVSFPADFLATSRP